MRRIADGTEVTAIEAARQLGIGLDYLYSLLWTGKVTGYKVGRVWRIPALAVTERMKALERLAPNRTSSGGASNEIRRNSVAT